MVVISIVVSASLVPDRNILKNLYNETSQAHYQAAG